MHYRELTMWRKAMDAAIEVYRLTLMLPREETYGMRSQLTRAAVSIPANIAEGWTRESLGTAPNSWQLRKDSWQRPTHC
jgi:four helix bundle protein